MKSAAELDHEYRLTLPGDEFHRPPGVYLDGNSLGLLGRRAEAALREALEAWRTLAVRGWGEGGEPWFGMSQRVAALLAPILGAEPGDVMVGGSTTLNLHQLLASFADPRNAPILIDGSHFPTDRYAVESFLRLHGHDAESGLEVVRPGADRLLDEAELVERMRAIGRTDRPRFAVLPAVVYTTGQQLDVKGLTDAGRAHGVRIAWDCSHSAGSVAHRFRGDGVELAFGCGYKYLNGGPGAPGWIYACPALRSARPGLAGWFGCDPARQFEMRAEFIPAPDANRFQLGTPHVLSLAPLLGSLQVILEVGMGRLRERSLALTDYLRGLAEARLGRYGIEVITPREPGRRGGHLTLAHPAAAALSRALRRRGVVPDFRPPDMLRLAPAALYTSFRDCHEAVERLDSILESSEHLRLDADHELVP